MLKGRRILAAAISLLASVITFAFTGAVLLQYLQRPRLHRLVWTVALLSYGVATSVQFVAEVRGWSTPAFRLWYLSGGLITAAYLGQGTALLLLPRRLSRILLAVLVALSVAGAARILTVPLALHDVLPPAGKVTPVSTHLTADLRALAALLNIYGTLLLIGGAIYSAVLFFDLALDRRRRAGHRFVSNLLIAVGALVVASAGSLETLGHGEYLYAGEIAGISIIYTGFLRSRESMRVPLSVRRQKQSTASEPHAAAGSVERPARSLKRLSDRTPAGRR